MKVIGEQERLAFMLLAQFMIFFGPPLVLITAVLNYFAMPLGFFVGAALWIKLLRWDLRSFKSWADAGRIVPPGRNFKP
jgi:hypothetical protein